MLVMIIIGPGALFLILLLMFRPVRLIFGWLLLLILAAGLYGCWVMPRP